MKAETRMALIVWWALIWRILLFSSLAGALLSLVVNIIAAVLRMPYETAGMIGFPFSIALSVYVGMRVVKYLMLKGFGPYRLAVVSRVEDHNA